MNIRQLTRKINKETSSHAVIRKNIFDFNYKSTRENTICLINPTPKQRIKAENIIVGNGFSISEIQGNKNNQGQICYYYIVEVN